jgi:ParB-like chromosome segregation protein Spo0J
MRLNGWNSKELAQSLNLSASTITQALSLLEQPEPIRKMVEQETLPARTAYEIQKLADPEKQLALADRVVKEKLTRDQTVKAVRQLKGKATASRKPRPTPLPEPPPEPPRVRAYVFPKGTRFSLTIPGNADIEDVVALENAFAQAGAAEAEKTS